MRWDRRFTIRIARAFGSPRATRTMAIRTTTPTINITITTTTIQIATMWTTRRSIDRRLSTRLRRLTSNRTNTKRTNRFFNFVFVFYYFFSHKYHSTGFFVASLVFRQFYVCFFFLFVFNVEIWIFVLLLLLLLLLLFFVVLALVLNASIKFITKLLKNTI